MNNQKVAGAIVAAAIKKVLAAQKPIVETSNDSPLVTVEPTPPPPTPLRVTITREMFDDWATISLPDGTTENLEPDELRQWFRIRGANMDVVEKALDYCWNFRKSVVIIQQPKFPPRSRLEPKI